MLLFLFFLGTFGFYIYVRTTRTLDLGRLFLWYGVITLVVECFGAVTVALYAINLLWDPVYNEFGEDIRKPGMPLVSSTLAALPFSDRQVFSWCCHFWLLL